MDIVNRFIEKDYGDLEPQEYHFKFRGKSYVLREASADAGVKYQNKQLAASKLGTDGKAYLGEGFADSQPYLVSLCLFEKTVVNGDVSERPVMGSLVRSWPNKLVKELFETAKEMSGLNEKDTEDSLVKEIADRQVKLDAIRSGRVEEEAKNV